MGCPSLADFKRMVHGNMLKNCPVRLTGIKNTHAIFGTNIGSLLGKTVRKNRNSNVGLCGNTRTDKRQDEDNWINCWINVRQQDPVRDVTWKNMKFITIKNMVDRKAATLLKALHSIKSVYTKIYIYINNSCTTNLKCYKTLYKMRESPSTLPQPMNKSHTPKEN